MTSGSRARTDVVLRSQRVVLPSGVQPAAVHVSNGVITHIGSLDEPLTSVRTTVEELGEQVLLPGLVDAHVHINEPGRTEWEGFVTATRSAAAGGITTLVDMPLNCIPATTTVDALIAKRVATVGKLWVDVGFWGGVVPGNQGELEGLIEAGVLGFKCFMVPSGVEEFGHVGMAELEAAAPVLAAAGVPLLAHAEAPEVIDPASVSLASLPLEARRDHRTWSRSRPHEAELDAIASLLGLAERFGCHVHIVHLATQRAAFRLDEARTDGLPLTVETCPHYLTFSERDIPLGATEFKCAPPIRDESNRLGLWEALRRGVIDMVVTDHSPSPPAMKALDRGDFVAAWGGIASLQVSLSAVWTEASRRGFTVSDIARWMSEKPAELAGLADRGRIECGRRADLCVFDPDATYTVDAATLHHRHKITPYHGRTLRGVVTGTWLAGQRIFQNGTLSTARWAESSGEPPMSEFRALVDLASERFGGMVEYANDEFFAEKENLVRAAEPVFDAGRYTDHGKWMDGWESRRRRTPGHDFCILRLGLPGVIRGVVVDTSHFTGNFPESCSVEAANLGGNPSVDVLTGDAIAWTTILPRTPLKGNSHNAFEVIDPHRYTHLRFHIFPDGGVARLRVHGLPVPNWRRLLGQGRSVDLVAAANGGRALGANDSHYGAPDNMLLPGRGVHMGDGWETRRRRGPGHDWTIFQLAAEGTVELVEVDTCHFKGNYPDRCTVEVIHAPGATFEELSRPETAWQPLLPMTPLRPHTLHGFDEELLPAGPITHARLSIHPDGGISRFHLFGCVTDAARESLMLEWLNGLSLSEALPLLERCCGSKRWATDLAIARPFDSRAALLEASESVFDTLDREDWLEAFAAHPAIGQRKSDAQDEVANRWSGQEQAAVRGAAEDLLDALAAANVAYAERFGYTYIVCATGRSADELLEMARARLQNDDGDELRVAAAEQRKITGLRLLKLLTP